MSRLRKPINKSKFKRILREYILPMLPTSDDLTFEEETAVFYEEHALIHFANGRIYFYSSSFPNSNLFCYSVKMTLGCENKAAAEKVLESMLVDEQYYRNSFNFTVRSQSRKKYSEFFDKNILEMSYEVGMLTWLMMERQTAVYAYELIGKLKIWHEKTYEGSPTGYGILVDLDTEEVGDKKYSDFIDKDESALFSDGRKSYVRLDRNLCYLEFSAGNEITEGMENEYDFVPREYELVSKNCQGNNIGIISTESSEIIIIKNRAIRFARIGGKWVYYNWNILNQAFREYGINDGNNEDSFKKSIYCSILDAVFSHKGACIGIILNQYEEQVINAIEATKDEGHDAIIENSFVDKEFHTIDRALRNEMLSVDGATIISHDGYIRYVGQIVPLKSLTRGGRRAGAKWLAQYGMGVKISEDGFVEAYGRKQNTDGNVVELFRWG